MPIKLAISPSTLIEGYKILNKSLSYKLKSFGRKGVIIGEEYIFNKFDRELSLILNNNTKKLFFNGECTNNEIERLSSLTKKHKASFVIGIGGGKAIDTAKAVAKKCLIPIITIPTSAATSAATTALSAVYYESGIASHYLLFDSAPDFVIIDYSLIATAPSRMLCAGIADSLAKYYESFAYTQGKTKNVYEQVALNTDQLLYDVIYKIGARAKNDIEQGIISDAFKQIVRINIVLAGIVGGIGGEGFRACAAHAVNNALTRVPYMRAFLHGEVVGFGNLMQLMLEDKKNELNKLKKLYKKLNLPYNFNYFKYKFKKGEFDKVVRYICSPKDTLKNMPRKISKYEVRENFKRLQVSTN